jgi:predicted TIM-barrel fold metal-dependent hydrolase
MIDANVSLFRWPFRRLAGDDPAELVARLRKKGVTQAWAGSYEALIMRDVSGVNTRLAAACREHGADFLVPFGVVNPKEPDWKEDLRRCQEVHKMPGIRLHPDYHGYKLDDPAVADLFTLAESRKMVVQLAFQMEDERTQFPLMMVPAVNPAPLADLLKRTPDLRVLLINRKRQITLAPEVAKSMNVYSDIAMWEGVGGVARLISQISPSRVVFGSHSPFFYFDSAFLKVREAGLPADQTQAVLEGNARALLKR